MPKPSFPQAIAACKKYREYLDTLTVSETEKTKSILLTREDIDNLLSMDGKQLDGIRIYIGHQEYPNKEVVVQLCAVAVEKKAIGSGFMYNDYRVPKKGEEQLADDPLGNQRPCPAECPDDNVLNS